MLTSPDCWKTNEPPRLREHKPTPRTKYLARTNLNIADAVRNAAEHKLHLSMSRRCQFGVLEPYAFVGRHPTENKQHGKGSEDQRSAVVMPMAMIMSPVESS